MGFHAVQLWWNATELALELEFYTVISLLFVEDLHLRSMVIIKNLKKELNFS